MKAITHFTAAAFLSGTLACSPPLVEETPIAPQAVRATQVRIGSLAEGRRHLAEVVPEQSVNVIAQVPGTVTAISVAEGAPALYGAALVRISAPDVAARVARVRSDRKRAERERDFVCSTLEADRALAKSGDLTSIALARSERSCASADLAATGAKAGEREASVAKARGLERAPFDGEVLTHLVDVGQTVMPGSPLLQYASRERLLRMRVPQSDLHGIKPGGQVRTEVGTGHILSVGAQAMGPGRVVEVLIKMDAELDLRVGTTLSATLVISQVKNASAVPEGAIAGVDDAHYIMVIADNKLERVEVTLGVREDGWVAVLPALAKGTHVVAQAPDTLDPSAPIWVVMP